MAVRPVAGRGSAVHRLPARIQVSAQMAGTTRLCAADALGSADPAGGGAQGIVHGQQCRRALSGTTGGRATESGRAICCVRLFADQGRGQVGGRPPRFAVADARRSRQEFACCRRRWDESRRRAGNYRLPPLQFPFSIFHSSAIRQEQAIRLNGILPAAAPVRRPEPRGRPATPPKRRPSPIGSLRSCRPASRRNISAGTRMAAASTCRPNSNPVAKVRSCHSFNMKEAPVAHPMQFRRWRTNTAFASPKQERLCRTPSIAGRTSSGGATVRRRRRIGSVASRNCQENRGNGSCGTANGPTTAAAATAGGTEGK
jgi:hypothetical protein